MKSPRNPNAMLLATAICTALAVAPPVEAGGFKIKTPSFIKKAVKKVKKTVSSSVKKVAEAANAIGNHVENTLESKIDVVAGTVDRLKAGELLDAAGYLTTQPLKDAEENAYKATQESEIVRAGAQIMASSAGPGGAAAFSAWQVYRATGDLESAFKAGAVSGATSAAFSALNEASSEGVGDLIGNSLTGGAVAATAVGVSGGDQTDVQQAFLLGAASTAANDLYQQFTKNPLDPRPGVGDATCKAGPSTASCFPEPETWMRDANGNVVMKNDVPVVDTRLLAPSGVPQTGIVSSGGGDGFWKDYFFDEQSPMMTTLSQVPAVNAGSVLHDHLVDTLGFGMVQNVATIAPAMAFTYLGTQGPVLQKITDQYEADGERFDATAYFDLATLESGSSRDVQHALRVLNGSADVSAVPVPPAVLLMGSSLAVVFLRRRT